MMKENENKYLTKEDIANLFMQKNKTPIKLLCLGQEGLKTVRLKKKDVHKICEEPASFRLIDINQKQLHQNKKQKNTYLVRIRKAQKAPLLILIGTKAERFATRNNSSFKNNEFS